MSFRTVLLGISALFIAAAAAYFSVTGLSKLFAGASTEVILMASSLEFGKLISASFLYTYWDKINKLLRAYLLIGVSVLILITSAGIYGFLTSAYQITADELTILDKETDVLELKKNRFDEQLVSFQTERDQLTKTISELSTGISTNVQTYKDSQGNILTSSSSANRRVFESQLKEARNQRDIVSQKIEVLVDSVTSLDIKILGLQSNNEVAAEVGPLKYMAEITGKPMGTIVNWFALLIIFVFDPLAVTLIIAFNTAMRIDKQERDEIKSEKEFKIYGDIISPPLDKEFGDTMDELLTSKVGNIPTKDRYNLKADTDKNEISNDVQTENLEYEYGLGDSDNDFGDSKIENNYELDTNTSNETVDVIDNKLDTLKADYTKRPVDVDGDGIIDGYDTNGDGLIDEMTPTSSARWRYAVNQKPYYARSGFDWGDTTKWLNDQNAINYWLKFIKPNRYPDNFDSKTY